MDKRLDGCVAIVTGGSTGIGAATVVALASHGASVCIDYMGSEAAAERVCEDATRSGGRAMRVEADISTEEGVGKLFAECRGELGVPNVLVNNAGVNAQGVHVADMSLEQWNKTLRVNLTGPFLCSRAFVRERRGRSGMARIINVSSIHEEIVFRGFADYDASKAGLWAFTRTLALEVAPQGIAVNGIAPGMVLTEMNEEALRDPKVLEEKTEHIPVHRAGKPQDIAGVIAFLCMDESSYITGASIRVDGGLSLNTGQGA
jgi:glucose 1-dehydrogenase